MTQNHTMSHRGCPSRRSAEGRGMRTSHSQFGGPFSERRTQELAQDFRFIPGLGIRPAWSTAWHIKRSRGTGFVLDIRVDSIINRTGHIRGHVDCFLLRTASKPLAGASILLQRCRASRAYRKFYVRLFEHEPLYCQRLYIQCLLRRGRVPGPSWESYIQCRLLCFV